MRIIFTMQIATQDRWLYLSQNGDWTSTTIFDALNKGVDKSVLTDDILKAHYWNRRGNLTAFNRVAIALCSEYKTRGVAFRVEHEAAKIVQINDYERNLKNPLVISLISTPVEI